MKTIKLKRPYFSAWKKFGWERDTWGVMIDLPQLKQLAEKGEKILFLFKEIKEQFEIDAKEALEFVENNESKITIKIPKTSGIVPTKIMKKVTNATIKD